MKNRSLLALSLAMALMRVAPGASAAGEEDLLLSFGEEEFLSIATGQKQLVAKAPAVASVITADDIRDLGANTLEEVLATVPGMHVSLSSTYFSPIYSVRGVYTDKNPQVLMLVNGVPITQTHMGNRGGRMNFPVRDIARIEVIRGPGSAVYGADALAGVINVITKTATQINGTEVGARVASFDTTEGWLLHGTRWGEVDVAFSLQGTKTDGDDSRRVNADAQSAFDFVLAYFGVAPVSRAPGPFATRAEGYDARIDLQYDKLQFRLWNWRQIDSGVGPGLALALDPEGSGEIDNYLFDAHYSDANLFADSVVELNMSYMDINARTRQTLFPAGAVLPIGDDGNIDVWHFTPMQFTDGYRGNPEFFEKHLRAEAIFSYDGFAGHKLRFAAGASRQEETGKERKNFGPGVLDLAHRNCDPLNCIIDGTLTDVSNTPYVFFRKEDRDIVYASLQDQWQVANDWNLTVGLRYDDYSDFGSTVNPRAALVWDASTDMTAKLLYGRAFRAPSFTELFVRNNPVALGNPDLDPEVSNTWELAFDYRASFDLRLGLNVFMYDIEDLIEFVPTGPGTQVARNIGEQNGHGFEIEAEWKPVQTLRLVANYSFQDSEDEELRKQASRSPEQQAYLRASWLPAGDWALTGELKWVADRNREPMDPRASIDDYTITNLNIERRNLFGRLDIGLRIRNLFDDDAREPSPFAAVPDGRGSLMPDDFPLEKRSTHLTARLRF